MKRGRSGLQVGWDSMCALQLCATRRMPIRVSLVEVSIKLE